MQIKNKHEEQLIEFGVDKYNAHMNGRATNGRILKSECTVENVQNINCVSSFVFVRKKKERLMERNNMLKAN